MGEQTCRVCNISKPLSNFSYRNDNKKYRTNCKECRAKEEAAKRYGTTVKAVEEIRRAQGNMCAICGTHADEIVHNTFSINPLVIDHCHTTLKIRGLLCPTCNAGLGHFKDNAEYLIKAAAYIQVNR